MRYILLMAITALLAVVPGVYGEIQGEKTAPAAASSEKTAETDSLQAGAPAAERPREKRFVAVVDKDGVQRVTMTGGGYYFDPNVVVVKVNVPVELTVRKEPGITPHDIAIRAPEAGIDFGVDLSTEPKVIKFTPTRTGKYAFDCTKRFLFFKSHKDRGMHGVLEVVE